MVEVAGSNPAKITKIKKMASVLMAFMVVLGFILLGLAIIVVFSYIRIAYTINRFKNRIEDTVVDGVKQVIVEHGPETVKYVKGKIKKK
jgi:hypothetical protein